MRSWWENKSWRLGNIGEQIVCIVREKKIHKNKLVFHIAYYPILCETKEHSVENSGSSKTGQGIQ